MHINNFNLDSIYRKEEYLRMILTKRTTVFKGNRNSLKSCYKRKDVLNKLKNFEENLF